MSFTFVQKTANTSSSTTSPITLTLNGTVAGNTIVVVAGGIMSTSGGFSASDGVNGAYSSPFSSGGCVGSVSRRVTSLYLINGLGGNLTITVSYGGTPNFWAANAREYSSTSTIVFDKSACVTSPGNTTTPTSDTVTTTGNGLLIGGMLDFNASSGGCGSTWTNCAANTDQNNVVFEAEDKLNQTAGTYSSDFTLGSPQSDWTANIMTFRDSAAVFTAVLTSELSIFAQPYIVGAY